MRSELVGPGRDEAARRLRLQEREKRLLWFSMIFGLLCAGVAFCYKVAEFIFTMSDEDAKGFADVPITVYFVVAAGWLCLLAWCFITGQFADNESIKVAMLAREEAYERAGE